MDAFEVVCWWVVVEVTVETTVVAGGSVEVRRRSNLGTCAPAFVGPFVVHLDEMLFVGLPHEVGVD